MHNQQMPYILLCLLLLSSGCEKGEQPQKPPTESTPQKPITIEEAKDKEKGLYLPNVVLVNGHRKTIEKEKPIYFSWVGSPSQLIDTLATLGIQNIVLDRPSKDELRFHSSEPIKASHAKEAFLIAIDQLGYLKKNTESETRIHPSMRQKPRIVSLSFSSNPQLASRMDVFPIQNHQLQITIEYDLEDYFRLPRVKKAKSTTSLPNEDCDSLFPWNSKEKRASRRLSVKAISSVIQKTEEDRYIIEKPILKKYLQQPAIFSFLMQACAQKEAGKLIGYQLTDIQQQSILYNAGLRNGDIIQQINGIELTSTNKAQKLSKALRSAKEITIELTRERKKRTLQYKTGIIASKAQKSKLPPSLSPKRLKSGIRKKGKNKYIIDQKIIDALQERPIWLAGQIRVTPTREDGVTIGYRLTGIRMNSFFHYVGIRNGDILQKINGMEITSMKKAMEVYSSLQNAKKFNVELRRKGQKQKLSFTIHPSKK